VHATDCGVRNSRLTSELPQSIQLSDGQTTLLLRPDLVWQDPVSATMQVWQNLCTQLLRNSAQADWNALEWRTADAPLTAKLTQKQ